MMRASTFISIGSEMKLHLYSRTGGKNGTNAVKLSDSSEVLP
jgi:hypothetical protein